LTVVVEAQISKNMAISRIACALSVVLMYISV